MQSRDNDRVPVFFSAPAQGPRLGVLMRGGIVSLVLFGLVVLGLTMSKPMRLGKMSSYSGSGGPAPTRVSAENPYADFDDAADQEALPLATGQRKVAKVLATRLDRYQVVGIGEWQANRQDADLWNEIVRHPAFLERASFIAVECAAALHQFTLDRYVAGLDVPRDDLQRVWRDVSVPGRCDSPVYAEFLTTVRDVNRQLPAGKKIRVWATDPIDWSQVKSKADWEAFMEQKEAVAAALVGRELDAQQKGILIYSAGNLWRHTLGVAMPAEQTVVARLDRSHPRRLFTVIRHHSAHRRGARLETMLEGLQTPVILPLRDTVWGMLPANDVLSGQVAVKLFTETMPVRSVTDAFIYSGANADTPVPPGAETKQDLPYQSELERRRALMRKPAP